MARFLAAFLANPYQTVAENVALFASLLVACGVVWRYVVQPAWKQWRRFKAKVHVVLELVQRELSPNGGSTLKDAVHRTDKKVEVIDREVSGLKAKTEENGNALEALAQIMDNVVDRKQEDHRKLWDAIEDLRGKQ